MVRTVFSGLKDLKIESIEDGGDVVIVGAATKGGEVGCPTCGTLTARVHALCERTPADVPVDGRRVVVRLRVRRLRCLARECPRLTFREQVPGVLERYQRRTMRLAGQLSAVARELAGRATARLAPTIGIRAGRDTALRALKSIELPERLVPAVLGIDDFALRRSREYATVLIDADTSQRIDVLPGRGGKVVTDWLREHPGVRVVCRDGSAAYAQAVRDALPDAVQVADRWHLWHGLAQAVAEEIAAHSACWAGAIGLQDGPLARTTTERWHQVHALLDQGVGLLDCARRLSLGLNTVKRYARASEPAQIQRVPKYGTTLVDPYRDHLRTRRQAEPGVPIAQLLREIRDLGYQGSSNLLHRYLNQGRADDERGHLSPRRAARLVLTRPDRLTGRQQERVDQLADACPEMTVLLRLVRAFTRLLKPSQDNVEQLAAWTETASTTDLPRVHSFVRGLDQDHDAVVAALTRPHHNGRTEGVNTRTKMLKRQMYGRASFALLRHRILLA